MFAVVVGDRLVAVAPLARVLAQEGDQDAVRQPQYRRLAEMQAALLGYAHRTVPRPSAVVGVPQPLLPVVDRRIVVLAAHDPAPGG